MAVERRRLATEAALEVLSALGIPEERPIVPKDSNNTVLHFRRAQVVAKVGTSHFRDAELESLERELAVAIHLARRQAPTVRPTSHINPGPHRSRNLTVTLWEFVESFPKPLAAPETAARLRSVHEALKDFDGFLPPFTRELADARRLLQPSRSPALGIEDRRFLLMVLDEVASAMVTFDTVERPLHGSPHEGNWLTTAQGLLLLDFETACVGPAEWDIAALDDDALAIFPDADRDLITLMKRMRSVCVAAKCWVEPLRAPEVFQAAHVHLQLLRQATGR